MRLIASRPDVETIAVFSMILLTLLFTTILVIQAID